MTRWHDPEVAVCSCFACTEARYHAALAAQAEEELAADRARAEEELAGRQLRLPMPGLAHCAHQSASL